MQFFNWMEGVFAGQSLLTVVLGLATVVLLMAGVVAYTIQNVGVYVAVTAVLLGGVGVAVAFGRVDGKAVWVGVSLLFVFGGVGYLLLFCALIARRVISTRKANRATVERRLQYTLPQRENMYVRERLNTALQVQGGGENEKKIKVRLGYARALLYKVQSAPLSVAERLQVEEMSKTFALYRGKDTWTAEELRGVNEWCAALLKLSAKYTV